MFEGALVGLSFLVVLVAAILHDVRFTKSKPTRPVPRSVEAQEARKTSAQLELALEDES